MYRWPDDKGIDPPASVYSEDSGPNPHAKCAGNHSVIPHNLDAEASQPPVLCGDRICGDDGQLAPRRISLLRLYVREQLKAWRALGIRKQQDPGVGEQPIATHQRAVDGSQCEGGQGCPQGRRFIRLQRISDLVPEPMLQHRVDATQHAQHHDN
ncbi:MAG: hypothetical protein H0W03_07810 [Solirubrobacterales bacterium]|nr:hypothetical protein [Solirubrobacterales bacterium]